VSSACKRQPVGRAALGVPMFGADMFRIGRQNRIKQPPCITQGGFLYIIKYRSFYLWPKATMAEFIMA